MCVIVLQISSENKLNTTPMNVFPENGHIPHRLPNVIHYIGTIAK